MNTNKDVLEIKWPWTLMPLELAGDWIKEIRKGLKEFEHKTKDIFPLAHNKYENLIVLEIDHGDSYIVVKYARTNRCGLLFKVECALSDNQELRNRIEHDHVDMVGKTIQRG
jgi:hypothetical protein